MKSMQENTKSMQDTNKTDLYGGLGCFFVCLGVALILVALKFADVL